MINIKRTGIKKNEQLSNNSAIFRENWPYFVIKVIVLVYLKKSHTVSGMDLIDVDKGDRYW